MKIIINTSTLVGSGVTQVAVSFLHECLNLQNQNEYHVFLGETVSKSILKEQFDSRFTFYDFRIKPLAIFKGGIRNVIRMRKLSKKISPDAIFTVFGPSWWTPDVPHLQGFANPYYIYKEGPYYKIIDTLTLLRLKFFEIVHSYFLKRNGTYFVTETEFVSRRLEKLLDIPMNSVYTVSNTCNSFFRDFQDDKRITFLRPKNKDEFRFISLCTMQGHKNLKILNNVIPLLKKAGYSEIKFVLTIDENSYIDSFSDDVKDNIINIGRISPSDCPYLFNECDALFLPTLAECFTANYPEAMVLNKPIVTSELPFAKDVCKDAAEFFDPMSAESIAKSIIKVYEDEIYRDRLIYEGNKVLKSLKSPRDRAISYLKILDEIKDK